MKHGNLEIPGRMYTSEVLELARWKCYSTLRKRQKEGLFPMPIDRGAEAIYSGKAVYKALGLIDEETEYPAEDPIMKALESL